MAAKKKTPALPVVRKLRFPLDPAKVRNWLGRQALSDLFHGLSIMFPDGEQEFIESVRPYVDRIDDPELKKQAEAFTKQEAHHMREHSRYNRILDALGYPAQRLEKEVGRQTRWTKKNVSGRTRLAFTVAAEHFTAVLADALLSDAFDLSGADETMAALWHWHAIEETEHKAVAFDVYEQTVGSYPHRVFTMAFITLMFSLNTARHANAFMRVDGIEPSEGWREIRHFFFKETKLGWRILKHYAKFYKPGFHPWDVDNRQFLRDWNDGYDELVDRLGIAA